MKRSRKALILFLSLVSIYLVLFFSPLSDAHREVLRAFPLWCVVTLGAHALFSIGLALFNFRDCDDAAVDLRREIDIAKSELSQKGIKFK